MSRELTEREKEIQQRVSKRVNAFMELHGMSRSQVAKGMGYTLTTLSSYLNGNVAIGYNALFTICEYLRISALDIDPTLARRLGHPELQRL